MFGFENGKWHEGHGQEMIAGLTGVCVQYPLDTVQRDRATAFRCVTDESD